MLSRDWQCQNCGKGFHSYDHGEPPCPHCGGRANWVPGGGHISSEFVKGCERTVKGLADGYGLSNLNTPSPSRVNRAMPMHPGVSAQPDRSLGIKRFAPGFSSYINPRAATCTPSLEGVGHRVSQMVGMRLAQSGNVPGPNVRGRQGLNTKIDGRHYPR
jgi:hypothetical protein